MGEVVSNATLIKQFERLRNVLVDIAAHLLADPVERAAAQQAQGMRMAEGSNSLTPLMMCMQVNNNYY